MPFAVGPDLPLLRPRSARRSCGSARCWRACSASTGLFSADHEDGSLDLLLLSPVPLELMAAAKGVAHWLATGLAARDRRAALRTPARRRAEGARRRHALALSRHAGAHLSRPHWCGDSRSRCRGADLLVAVLTLPLAHPDLDLRCRCDRRRHRRRSGLRHAVQADRWRSRLFFLVLGPIAAAAALRQARD